MKEIRIICLALVVVLGLVGNATANRRSSYFTFFGQDGKEYSIVTSTSSGIDGEDFLTVDTSQFETFEEAQNALLITFRETLGGKSSATFFTEYSKTRDGRLNLSLSNSFMRTSQGKKIFADVPMFVRKRR